MLKAVERRKRAWRKGVQRHGKTKMIWGLATAPLWVPVWGAMNIFAGGCQKAGKFGDWLSCKI